MPALANDARRPVPRLGGRRPAGRGSPRFSTCIARSTSSTGRPSISSTTRRALRCRPTGRPPARVDIVVCTTGDDHCSAGSRSRPGPSPTIRPTAAAAAGLRMPRGAPRSAGRLRLLRLSRGRPDCARPLAVCQARRGSPSSSATACCSSPTATRSARSAWCTRRTSTAISRPGVTAPYQDLDGSRSRPGGCSARRSPSVRARNPARGLLLPQCPADGGLGEPARLPRPRHPVRRPAGERGDARRHADVPHLQGEPPRCAASWRSSISARASSASSGGGATPGSRAVDGGEDRVRERKNTFPISARSRNFGRSRSLPGREKYALAVDAEVPLAVITMERLTDAFRTNSETRRSIHTRSPSGSPPVVHSRSDLRGIQSITFLFGFAQEVVISGGSPAPHCCEHQVGPGLAT